MSRITAKDAERVSSTHRLSATCGARCSTSLRLRRRAPSTVRSAADVTADRDHRCVSPEATGPTCYGPNLRALVCYLVVRQHVPIKRVAELMRDSYGIAKG